MPRAFPQEIGPTASENVRNPAAVRKNPRSIALPAHVRQWRPGRQASAGGGTRLAHPLTMSHIITQRRLLGVFEHVLAIVVGFILMVLGLGLSVTMIMLPLGLVVGLAGLAMFIAGTCVRFEWI